MVTGFADTKEVGAGFNFRPARQERLVSPSFDPYHKWLGIPPKHQPPSHYRLLGIALFEGDRDVIAAAVAQRSSFLQGHASGPQAAWAERLLSEVAEAQRCLTDAAQKSTYDARLKARRETARHAANAAPANTKAAPSVPIPMPPDGPDPEPAPPPVVTGDSVVPPPVASVPPSPPPASPSGVRPSSPVPHVVAVVRADSPRSLGRMSHRETNPVLAVGFAVIAILVLAAVAYLATGLRSGKGDSRPPVDDLADADANQGAEVREDGGDGAGLAGASAVDGVPDPETDPFPDRERRAVAVTRLPIAALGAGSGARPATGVPGYEAGGRAVAPNGGWSADDVMIVDNDEVADEADSPPPVPRVRLDDPAGVLAERGLAQQENYWLLANDDELQAGIRVCDERAQLYTAAEKAVQDLLATIQRLCERRSLAERDATASSIDAGRRELAQANRAYREAFIKSVAARGELTAVVVQAVSAAAQLATRYEQLLDDPLVPEALRQLAPANRLGPSPTFAKNRERLAMWEEQLLTDRVPGFWGEKDLTAFYTSVVVNERAAAVLALRRDADVNLLPEGVAQAAGIVVPAERTADVTVRGVSFRAAQVTILALRLGSYVGRDIAAYVVPADGPPVEGQLSLAAFPSATLELVLGQNVLTVKRKD